MPSCEKCGSYVEDTQTKCPFCGHIFSKDDFNTFETKEIDNLDEIIQQESIEPIIQETELEDTIVFHTPELEEMEQLENRKEMIELEIIPERKYIYWFLLGIITVGIFFLVYLFINIEDLDRHSHYPNNPRGEPINVNTSQTLMIFLCAICFGFIPILWWIYYKKYTSLYYHLKEQKYELAPRKLPHPALYLVPLILSHILALIPTIIAFITEENIRFTIPALFWSIIVMIFVLTSITFYFDYLWQRAFNAHNKITFAQMNIKKENAHQI